MKKVFKYSYVEFEQPIGSFFLTTVPAKDLLGFYEITRRQYIDDQANGTQRNYGSRIKDIANYCNTLDAAFPTSIILALKKDGYVLDENKSIIEITNKAEIIDGQHRILGLELAKEKFGDEIEEKFTFPCVFLLEPTDPQKAFVFATINGKQTKVNKSLVYDLFGTSERKDPYNILHTLARILNFSSDSPFYQKLKMLGKKSDDIKTESLTQGTFVDTLVSKISKEPLTDSDFIKRGKIDKITKNQDLIFQDYMLQGKGELLVPLFKNIFNAVKNTWPNEWEIHDTYILSKTTGYIGIMKGLDKFIKYGRVNGVLTEKYFEFIFLKVKDNMIVKGLKFISDDFPPGGKGENKLRDILIEVYTNHFPLEQSVIDQLKMTK
jgi:DGQHR domain-containing protein